MKSTPFASRRFIHQTTFSPDLSSKRLDKVQSLLKNSSLDGILAILGIDSKYNDGCRQLANYLLFGFYKLDLENFKEVEIAEDDLEEPCKAIHVLRAPRDVSTRTTSEDWPAISNQFEDRWNLPHVIDLVLFVRKTSVSIYCCRNLYHYLLPYVAHWRNLEVHCLSGDEQNDINEDVEEEFKIRSLVSMLHGLSNIGIPYATARRSPNRQTGNFAPLLIEKWPLIQSYALEEVGGGKFFTMQFNVVSVHEELEPIYEECDPAHLELILTQSLPLLERHWFETMHCLKGSDNAAMLDVSEQVVAEPLVSYFNHGRLAPPGDRLLSISAARPSVGFGTRTSSFPQQTVSSTATLRNSGRKGRALHMIIEGCSPRKPLSCCRTYFLTPQNQTEQRNVDLLRNLYRECVKACKDAIAEYCLHLDPSKLCSVADRVLSVACEKYCSSAKYWCKLEVLDNSCRVLDPIKAKSSFQIKRLLVYITGVIGADGELLGSVSFADSFINSALRVRADGSGDVLINSDRIILTSGIPAFVQWSIAPEPVYCGLKSFANLCGAYLCSDSVLLGEYIICDVEMYDDCSMVVRTQHLPPLYIPASAISKLLSYSPEAPNSVRLLQLDIKPGSNLAGWIDDDSRIAFAFFPQTDASRVFANLIESHLERKGLYSPLDRVHPLLNQSYSSLQSSCEWISARGHRDAARSSSLDNAASSLQPKLSGFLNHFSSSFVLSNSVVPAENVEEVIKREVSVRNVKSKDGKVCITIVCGLPGSHAERLCASMVALHKEKVRWVVVRVQTQSGDARLVDKEHLQSQLSGLVVKRKAMRPGVAATKRLRVILEAVGFFDIATVVSCVLNHKNATTRNQMFIGAVSACIEPLSVYLHHSRLFPNVLEQCSRGLVSNVIFTGVLEELKDRNLATMQAMIRNVNGGAAFLLAPSGHLRRTVDFDLILNENSFDAEDCRVGRFLSLPGIWNGTFVAHPPTIPIYEYKFHFSQPLLRGTFCARLRALKHNLAPFPFTGNVYMVMGTVKFTEAASTLEESKLCFVTRTQSLDIEPLVASGVIPAPPSGKPVAACRPYHLRFYGVGLNEESLREWIRKCGRQAPTKKAHRSRESLSKAERNKIQSCHQQDSLPEGIFFNGSQYCSLADNSRSYEHPCLEIFIDEYLKSENQKIDEYNAKIEKQNVPDMFDAVL